MAQKGYTYSLHHHAGNLIGARVARWSSVLKVTLALHCTLSRNSDTRTTVGNTPAEFVNVSSLMFTGETFAVALPVDFNVLDMTLLKLLHGCLDVLHSTFFTHSLGRYISVKTSTVPVTGYGLGGEGDDDTEFFGNAVEQETGHPKLVTDYMGNQLCPLLSSGSLYLRLIPSQGPTWNSH